MEAKVSVTGYQQSTGGAIIIKLNEPALSVDKDDVDQSIASACKALSKMNYKDYDGVNIKITADDNQTVGSAHVDKNNIPKVTKSSLAGATTDYQDNGN